MAEVLWMASLLLFGLTVGSEIAFTLINPFIPSISLYAIFCLWILGSWVRVEMAFIWSVAAAKFMRQLAYVILINEQGEDDKFDWLPSSQRFSVKSAHFLQAGWTMLPRWRVWDRIWHLNVQERIRFFMWKLSHARLLLNEACWRRGLAQSPSCSRCDGGIEDCLHILRDCEDSVVVWL